MKKPDIRDKKHNLYANNIEWLRHWKDGDPNSISHAFIKDAPFSTERAICGGWDRGRYPNGGAAPFLLSRWVTCSRCDHKIRIASGLSEDEGYPDWAIPESFEDALREGEITSETLPFELFYVWLEDPAALEGFDLRYLWQQLIEALNGHYRRDEMKIQANGLRPFFLDETGKIDETGETVAAFLIKQDFSFFMVGLPSYINKGA